MTETIPAALREAAQRFGEKPALLTPHVAPMGFAELCNLASAFAKALLADGMAGGDRLALWAPNQAEWIAAAVGAQRTGGTIVPLYARLRGAEVAEVLERAKVTFLVTTSELAALLPQGRSETLRRIVCIDPGAENLHGRAMRWRDFLHRGDNVSDEALRQREAGVTGDTVSDIMFTSGTTGRPKGAVFDHRSAVLAAHSMRIYNGATPADVFCPMGTFSHIGGYKQGWLTGLVSGAAVCWGDAFDPASALHLIAELGVTIMPAAPITWQGILDNPDRARFDISSLRFAATGATTIPPEVVRRLQTDMRIAQVGTGYGMTESSGLAAFTLPDDPVEVVSTVGKPAPDTEIRIIDAEGNPCPPETAGEILIRNPRLLIEYLDDPDATREAFTEDCWFRSGDVGSFDADGYLRITDRLKDMYIINGLNVYPAEVERCIEQIAGVGECAVVGLPAERKGEVGVAFIVRGPGSALGTDEVIEFCRQSLAHYKVPVQVAFVEQLPRNAMGKVLKNELRQLTLSPNNP